MVVPMYNAEATIREALLSLLTQEGVRPTEIIVVDDGSTDSSARIVEGMAREHPEVRLMRHQHGGAARTTNRGIREAKGELIGLLDSDAMVDIRWLATLVKAFEDPEVYAAAGRIEIANPGAAWARLAGSELLLRYSKLSGRYVDHVSTCNVLYRREVFEEAGLFNPRFAIGYDVDMSYRIGKMGKKMYHCPEAICFNFWRERMYAYYRQQFRYAYDRAELIRSHEGKVRGDDVSGPRMFMQVPLTAALLLSVGVLGIQVVTLRGAAWWFVPLALLGAILVERLHEALTTFRITKDPIAFLLPPVHLVRNVAWLMGVAYWAARRFGARGKAGQIGG
jgi:GT2 family glycosyltransferase